MVVGFWDDGRYFRGEVGWEDYVKEPLAIQKLNLFCVKNI